MTIKNTLRLVPFVVLSLLTPVGAQQANNEEFARRQYESGMTFMQNRRFADAVKDLQAVADSFPETTIADNALLQIAEYQINIAHDTDATQRAVDRLLKDFANSDSAPMAHVLNGRISIAKGRTPADVDSAMASFERVSRLFPGTEGVAAAGFYAGETLRIMKRSDEALERYRRVRIEFPRSVWAARSAMGTAYCLVQQGNGVRALPEIQWVRQQFPNTDVAADALNLNTILYRLYVRPPAQPPYAFSGKALGPERSQFNDVMGLRREPNGRFLLGHKNGVTVLDDKGAILSSLTAQETSTFYVDGERIVVAHASNIILDKSTTQTLIINEKDGKTRFVEEMPAILLRPKGERLVSDLKEKTVIRIDGEGKFIGNFAQAAAIKMTTNSMDDVAMLDKDTKSVFFSDRDGKALGRLSSKGAGYEFGDPVDIAFDFFDQLYVLDRGRSSVFVFAPKTNKLVATATIPDKGAGAFNNARAFSLDTAGRLFIFDERAKRIQVYQ